MIYNSKMIGNDFIESSRIVPALSMKMCIYYCLLGFLFSRVNLFLYMAPVGVTFFITVISKNDRVLSVLVGICSILGYFTIGHAFIMYDLYVIIDLILVLFSLLSVKKNGKIVSFILVGLCVYFYKYFIVKFSVYSSLFYFFVELSIIFALYLVFSTFIRIMDLFNNNRIFTREEVICSIVTICLAIMGFNGIKVYNLDLVNILLLVFVFIISYINGISIGAVAAVFSGSVIGVMYSEFTQYVAIYSIVSCISSLFYLSSRFIIAIFCSVCIFMLNFSMITFNSFGENRFLMEFFTSVVVFLILPKKILDRFLICFNEDYKREFYTRKRLFNTLDMRIQKINDLNDLIKQLSDMMVSNIDFRYKIMDKKIYIEILAESICRNCKRVGTCWRDNFKLISDELFVSLENFIQGNKKITEYVDEVCVNKEGINSELTKIAKFHNMQEVYEEKIRDTQDILSNELSNIYSVIDQGIKEVRKDIVVKVDYEKSIISSFNKFKIRYTDFLCYDENGRVKLKVIIPIKVYDECRLDILEIINISLPTGVMFQEGNSKYMNSNNEMVLDYVERYDYKLVSHCLQLSKSDKNGDNYMIIQNSNDSYVIILSDGIGSGVNAHDKSKFTVDLIYKFMHTSLDLSSCIREIISIISLKFFKDESVSTIDFSSINLYSGKMRYLKFSSVVTYVKRGKDVFILENEKYVFDSIDDNDFVIGEFELEYGDIIVHLTDGLIHFRDLSNKAWLYNFLKRIDSLSPDKLCEDIIQEFKILTNGCYQDDVTVIVSKVYKNFA